MYIHIHIHMYMYHITDFWYSKLVFCRFCRNNSIFQLSCYGICAFIFFFIYFNVNQAQTSCYIKIINNLCQFFTTATLHISIDIDFKSINKLSTLYIFSRFFKFHISIYVLYNMCRPKKFNSFKSTKPTIARTHMYVMCLHAYGQTRISIR